MAKKTTKPAKASAKKTTAAKAKKKVAKPAPKKAKKTVAKKVKKAAPKKAAKKTAPKKVARKVSTRKTGKSFAKGAYYCTVILVSAGGNKVRLARAIKEITTLGMKECQAIVSGKLPIVLREGVNETEADNIAQQITEVGGTAEITYRG